ncbi:unnamed protein product [Owenia fusiformis]|uniref:Uncharacterized protein n=1 Tax=Owenia fusiformis TaxID=6347 RepID=A0A8J1UYA6_OWEFU|nr:unnamed protein product [Owenia fusiformis]
MVIQWLIFCLGCILVQAAQKKSGGQGIINIKADLLNLKNAVNTLVKTQTALKDYLQEELASIRDEVSNLRDDVANLRDGESNVRDNVLEIKEDMIELKKQFDDTDVSKGSSQGLCNATLVAAELKQDFNGINAQMNNVLDKCEAVARSNCTTAKYGEVSVSPGVTCLDIQKRRLPEILPSGVYWVTLGNPGVQQLYCDMVTDGGGWTLVWTYTFTDYANFDSFTNAVTPHPSWIDIGYTTANTPVSTSPPLSETQLGALEFAKWGRIGSEFMMKSNINQWVACTPATGSFVNLRSGSLDCRMVKVVASECTTVVPNRIQIHNARGPALYATSDYFFFDTNKQSNWPTHDPCGSGALNHINDVVNPSGSIFLR